MAKLDSIQKWRIEMLAKNGGFSDRFICSMVFEKLINRVTDHQLFQVRNYRLKNGWKLTDWRAGRTPLAIQHAQTVSRYRKMRKKRA